MIEEADLMNKNVYVIAISGVYRSGKSFLLNLLYTYMAYYIKVIIASNMHNKLKLIASWP